MKNPFILLGSNVIYENPYVTLIEDRIIRPDGSAGVFAFTRMKPGAIILALSADRKVCLVREYKYAVGRATLELIGGGIDSGETPLQAAQRELAEEAGLFASHWTPMGVTDPFTTMANSPNHLFLAEGIEPLHGSHPDDGEILELLAVSLEEAVEMVFDSKITHGPTCLLLLRTAETLRRREALDMGKQRGK